MSEGRAVLSLASILSFRMLGLFMIYPVFAIQATGYSHASATLIGIALGIYGLTQALFQLPLSRLSDLVGRRPIIAAGLIAFALGSVLCALTMNIYWLILGRALQGSGAIGSTLMAFAADLTSNKNRTKAMAILGMTIGLSFSLAMIIGPLLYSWFQLSGIFWLTAFFALVGILIQYFFLPAKSKKIDQPTKEPFFQVILHLLRQRGMLELNISIFFLHAIFTANFIVIPLLLSHLGIPSAAEWKLYLPVLLIAFILSIPLLVISERKNKVKMSLLLGVLLIGIAEFLLCTYPLIKISIMAGLLIFFTGFTLLESTLPSLLSKIAPINHKGSAMGIYSTFQFLGIFFGGALAGLTRGYLGNEAIYYLCIILCVIWCIYLLYMKKPNGIAYLKLHSKITNYDSIES